MFDFWVAKVISHYQTGALLDLSNEQHICTRIYNDDTDYTDEVYEEDEANRKVLHSLLSLIYSIEVVFSVLIWTFSFLMFLIVVVVLVEKDWGRCEEVEITEPYRQ